MNSGEWTLRVVGVLGMMLANPWGMVSRAADGCGTKTLGKIAVATLNSAPFVTLSATGHAVTLILDTGA